MSTVYQVKYSLSAQEEPEGYQFKNVLASYVHLHFRGNPTAARSLVMAAQRAKGVEAPA
jgi:cobyrinic acid a,c-diamide synthase